MYGDSSRSNESGWKSFAFLGCADKRGSHTLLFGVQALGRRVLINPQLQFALAIGAAAMHVCDILNSVYMAGWKLAPVV